MVRAIETAIHILGSHPEKSSFKLLLDPTLKEFMNTACDVPLHPSELKQKVNDLSEKHKIEIDASDKRLENDAWMLEFLTNTKFKNRIAERIEDTNLFDALMDDFRQFGPGENDHDLYQRT